MDVGSKEEVMKAVEALNKSEFKGSVVLVNVVQPKQPSTKKSSGGSVFKMHFSLTFQEHQLKYS